MDLILIIIGLLFCLAGIVGSVIPILPGPPVSWIGLLLLHLTNGVPISYWFLGITFVVAITIFILDYIIPAIGTKRFGGSRAGAIGAIIGLFIGILAPIPFGILIGPFVGALIGELAFNKTLKKVVDVNDSGEDKCPKHGLKGRYVPPSELDGTVLYITYECPKGHKFTKTASTLK